MGSARLTPVRPLTGTSPSVKTSLHFSFADEPRRIDEQAALKGVNEEQTASLQTALLHRRVMRLWCGPRCEPLSGAEARGSKSDCANWYGPKGRSSATPLAAGPIRFPWASTIRLIARAAHSRRPARHTFDSYFGAVRNGFNTGTPNDLKSATLRVTTVS